MNRSLNVTIWVNAKKVLHFLMNCKFSLQKIHLNVILILCNQNIGVLNQVFGRQKRTLNTNFCRERKVQKATKSKKLKLKEIQWLNINLCVKFNDTIVDFEVIFSLNFS